MQWSLGLRPRSDMLAFKYGSELILEQGSRADMRYTSLKDFLKSHHARKAADPLAMIFVEDDVEIDTTARHHQKAGFKTILMFMPSRFDLAPDVDAMVIGSITI